jgi:hypothetical protein
MPIALILICTFLGLLATGSAAGKLTRNPKVLESLHGVGVTDSQIPKLALLELLGALGLVVGIFVPGIGFASTIGLTLYFSGAVIAHLRKRQGIAEWAPALVLTVLALVAVLLQLQR